MPKNCSWCNFVDCHGDAMWFCDALEDLVQIDDVRDPRCPLADVQPVKHGKWQKGYCSLCGYNWGADAPIASVPNYCPDCGAKMDGET